MAFAGAMLGLVLADDLLLYLFWELTTVFSYLLIGQDPPNQPDAPQVFRRWS